MSTQPKNAVAATRIVVLATAAIWLTLAGNALAQNAASQAGNTDDPTVEAAARKAASLMQAGDWAAAADAYGALTKSQPDNARFWSRLAASYHQLGEYQKAIGAYERAEALGAPVPFTAYNLACAHALLGEKEAAFRRLSEAVDAGFRQLGTIQSDTDLDVLRDDARFDALVERVEAVAFPCRANPDYAKLDFWIGSWDVYVNGQLAGTNEIASVADGCALTESWQNVAGGRGVSLNYFDPTAGKYHQTWVASSGVTEYVEESASDGELVLVATSVGADGATTLTRLTFTRIGANVRQLFENSTDGGQTWTPAFDGTYVPKGTTEQ